MCGVPNRQPGGGGGGGEKERKRERKRGIVTNRFEFNIFWLLLTSLQQCNLLQNAQQLLLLLLFFFDESTTTCWATGQWMFVQQKHQILMQHVVRITYTHVYIH